MRVKEISEKETKLLCVREKKTDQRQEKRKQERDKKTS